jgi:uncharacterized protein (DUF427 family)
VQETHLDQEIEVEVNGERIASSHDVVKVEEDGNLARYYFPRRDAAMVKLRRSCATSQCPYKGTAHYLGIRAGGRAFSDAVWTYEEPYTEHAGSKDRVAFNEGKFPEIAITHGN